MDAAHSRCPEYNGVHLLMIGRNSDGKNVIYGHALVPKETKRNYIWFFSRMIEAGFDFTIVVIFIDRGFARNAAEYIFEVYWISNTALYTSLEICVIFWASPMTATSMD